MIKQTIGIGNKEDSSCCEEFPYFYLSCLLSQLKVKDQAIKRYGTRYLFSVLRSDFPFRKTKMWYFSVS